MSEIERREFPGALTFERAKGKDGKDEVRVGGLLVPYAREQTLSERMGVTVTEEFAMNSVEPRDDAVYLLSHDRARPVASLRAGTLVIEQRTSGKAPGVWVRATLDMEDPDARSLVSKVRGEAYGGQSVGFTPLEEDRTEERDEDGNLIKVKYTVRRATMFEASAVTWPAYTDTNVVTLSKRRADEVDRLARTLPPQLRAQIARAKLGLAS